MRLKPQPSWVQIASYYAGRPVTIGVDTRGPEGATTGIPESGKILLGSGIQSRLDDFARDWARAKTQKQRMAMAAYGGNALSKLIHEALHNRHFTEGYFDDRSPQTGFRNAGNESQAIALGAELIPDLLQRFYGVKIGSPVSRAFARAAKNAEYRGAYAVNGVNLP